MRSKLIASLTMYERPELEGTHRRYWALIRKHLRAENIDSPEHLSQDMDEFAVWQSPDLVLSQTCGMPYRKWLHDKVSLVGTPDYGVEGCPPGYYRSAIIVRREDARLQIEDFRDAVFAYNQDFSQSGYAAPYWHTAPKEFWFENRLHTGQHLASARAVADGQADIAALDAVSWHLMTRYDGFANDLRVLDWTVPRPGLPLISARGADTAGIFRAVTGAIAELDEENREKLGLKGLEAIPREDYLAIGNP